MTPGTTTTMKTIAVLAVSALSVLFITTGMRQPATAVPSTTRATGDDQGGEKSVKFSHQNHVVEREIACADCHTAAPGSESSLDRLIPDHQSCETCHGEAIESDCAYCHTNPDQIEAMVLPSRDLIFSHKKHAGTGGIACETCHGGSPPNGSGNDGGEEPGGDDAKHSDAGSTESHMPGMAMCTDCHTTNQVSVNCETCHSNFANLIPEDHLVSGFSKEHRRAARVGSMDVSCQTCHTESFCQDCHTGDQLRGFGGTRGLMTVPGARQALKDSPDELRLQAAHDLNYRFTHSIDARNRMIDCSGCHDRQAFCADCHQNGGMLTEGKIKPQSHFEAGWIMIGAGSGGGRHAQMGRRDIESCVSCHDVEGQDPTCVLCHSGR
jgi:hypothetical protein